MADQEVSEEITVDSQIQEVSGVTTVDSLDRETSEVSLEEVPALTVCRTIIQLLGTVILITDIIEEFFTAP